jgi:HAD superfamily hydrolase (TIGR01549 family)
LASRPPRIKAKQSKEIIVRPESPQAKNASHALLHHFCLLHRFVAECAGFYSENKSRGFFVIEAVIFDIDGTLVDSVDLHAQAWKEAFKHFGKDVPYQQVRHQIGKGGDQLMPVFFSREELERFGEELEEYRSKLYKRDYIERVRAFPNVRELFLRIREDDRRIALASSAKADELSHYKRVANIEDLVEEETSADDAEKSKPHPDIFQAALDELGLSDAARAVIIGDTPYDAEAAGGAGLKKRIGLLCGGFPEKELRAAGMVEIYEDPADLLKHYQDSMLGKN